jgi:hypothetical protein
MFTKNNVQKLIDVLLQVILIVFPFMVNIALISPKDPGHPILSVNLSIADVLIGIVLTIWVMKIIVFKEVRRVKLPPLPILLFLGIGTISAVNAFSIKDWLKDLIQFMEYLFIFYILILNNLQNIAIKRLKNILFISATCIVFIALVQHVLLHGSPYLIRGVFENRVILGAYLCMVIPLVFADFLYTQNMYRRFWLGTVMVISLLVLTSASALLSIIAGLFVISIVHSRKLLFRYLMIIILMIIAYSFIMPEKNIQEIKNFCSIYEQGKISENYYRRLTILGDLKKSVLLNKKTGDNTLIISNDLFMPSVLRQIRKGDRYKEMDNTKHIQQRYLEMQAALNIIAENTLLGVGLGNYQENIGKSYGELPKVNTSEPNQFNGYLIIGVTMGILGLAAFFWIFISSLKTNYLKFRNPTINEEHSGLYLGLVGSISACMVENCFSFLLVAALFVPFVFLIYLSTKENTQYE